VTFFDALDTVKGPSLGTNFTLSSPYVILAHYGELEWVSHPLLSFGVWFLLFVHWWRGRSERIVLIKTQCAKWGVEADLIRFSVGLEETGKLVDTFKRALAALEK
jgi:cystathionine gamma-synthase